MRKKRGLAQAGLEYLILGGFVFFGMLIAITLIYQYGKSSYEDLTISQVDELCNDIISVAEEVYYLGEPSKQTISAQIPDGIFDIYIIKNDPAITNCEKCTELRFSLRKEGRAFDVACATHVNLTGSFTSRSWSPGMKKIEIKALSDNVNISIPS